MSTPKPTCFILQGPSGSGKSTYAKLLQSRYIRGNLIVSADAFFEVSGSYQFDPSKLGEAHATCLRTFTSYVRLMHEPAIRADLQRRGLWPEALIVDNTNTTVADVAPYVALANAYGWDVQLHRLTTPTETAAARNVHGVPAKTVDRMAKNLEYFDRQAPAHWPKPVLVSGTAPGATP